MHRICISLSLFIIAFALLISCAIAEDNSKVEIWPKTVDDAVVNIFSSMPDKDKDTIQNTKKMI